MICLNLAADILGNASYGAQLRKVDILGYGETEGLGDFAEGLHLLDRVNAQICFQVQVGFQHVPGITGLLGDHGRDLLRDVRATVRT